MRRAARSIDIGEQPELLHIVEEVARTGESRVLRRDEEDLAVITPLLARRRRPPTNADYEAALAAAGGWVDVDLERFLAANAESRRLARPQAER